MTAHAHSSLYSKIKQIDVCPESDSDFEEWRTGNRHLSLLHANGEENELIIAVLGPYSYVRTVFVDQSAIESSSPEALLDWQPAHYEGLVKYSWVYPDGRVTLEREYSAVDRPWILDAESPIFYRFIEGVKDEYGSSWEPRQEYIHAIDAHHRPDRHAYSKLDRDGDWIDLISITEKRGSSPEDLTLVTFRREQLVEYLAIRDLVMLQMFDFALYRNPFGTNSSWQGSTESSVLYHGQMIYRRRTGDGATACRGIQIIPPRISRDLAEKRIRDNGVWSTVKEFVTFKVLDMRQDKVREVSTDPDSTINYFQATDDDRPWETSPAFFNSEVLLRFKNNPEKYRVSDNHIYCRAAWDVPYHVNDANQVSVYICDLRTLPLKQQRYWQSFNEEPEAGLNKRAITTDFLGQWLEEDEPLDLVKAILFDWHQRQVPWWKLIDVSSLHGLTGPVTSSRGEWQDAVLMLCATVVDGFRVKHLQDFANVAEDEKLGSIGLLRVIGERAMGIPARDVLMALHDLQDLRSRGGKAHARSEGGLPMAQSILTEHGSYRSHFNDLCSRLANDLQQIDSMLSDVAQH